jgi:putative Holliday junction resolvase
MRILGVDPGEKRIGLAISDETGMIANPVGVVIHSSRNKDADVILSQARELNAGLIIIGQALDEEGKPTASSRSAERLADEIRSRGEVPVEMVDEYGSTNEAQTTAFEMGLKRKNRRGHRDTIAAVIILQRYLDQTE